MRYSLKIIILMCEYDNKEILKQGGVLNYALIFMEAGLVARIGTGINVSNCYFAKYVWTIMFAFIFLCQFLFCKAI